MQDLNNEQLAVKARSGDKQSLELLWSRNQPLIKRTVWSFTGGNYPAEVKNGRKQPNSDLMQEAFICMADSLEDFDHDKGYKYITFYLQRLKWHLISIVNSSGVVTAPAYIGSLRYRIRNYEESYYKQYGSYPSDTDICETIQISQKMLECCRMMDLPLMSLDADINDSGDCDNLYELLENKAAADVDTMVMDSIRSREIKRLWDVIAKVCTARETEILKQRFGHGSTLSDIGQHYNVTKERARVIIENALIKVRRSGLCQKELELFSETGILDRGYYKGGFDRWKNSGFSSTERMALHNARYPAKSSEDMKTLEKDLISFFGNVV